MMFGRPWKKWGFGTLRLNWIKEPATKGLLWLDNGSGGLQSPWDDNDTWSES